MEERVINILLDIKADIGGLKKGQEEIIKDVTALKDGQQRLDGRMSAMEADISDLKPDMSEVKTTVTALGDALLETSREVKHIKGKSAHH